MVEAISRTSADPWAPGGPGHRFIAVARVADARRDSYRIIASIRWKVQDQY
jgi:hypothetical protein